MKTSLIAEGFDDKLVPVYTSANYFVQSRHWHALTSTECMLKNGILHREKLSTTANQQPKPITAFIFSFACLQDSP
jgi:hypothetical protein